MPKTNNGEALAPCTHDGLFICVCGRTIIEQTKQTPPWTHTEDRKKKYHGIAVVLLLSYTLFLPISLHRHTFKEVIHPSIHPSLLL